MTGMIRTGRPLLSVKRGIPLSPVRITVSRAKELNTGNLYHFVGRRTAARPALFHTDWVRLGEKLGSD